MTIIRVFPRKTNLTPIDDLAVIGGHYVSVGDKTVWQPYPVRMDLPRNVEVHISVTFTWDKEAGEYLQKAWSQYYPVVKLGGPAFDDPCNEFIAGKYVRHGVTFTSRGCNNKCPWCLVSRREGKLTLIDNFQAGNFIQDNNFLQCPKQHRANVYSMLKTQRDIELSGGLEADLLTEWDVEQLKGLRIKQLFFACDVRAHLKRLQKAGDMFGDNSHSKLRSYVLIAFNGQTISEAEEHLENVWAAGFMPHAQLFQPPDKLIEYSKEWKDLARKWSRPAIMRSMHKKESVT